MLEVLENDTDPDGDVLTVAATTEVAESQGRLELIDGGRALQFTPAEGAAGTRVVPLHASTTAAAGVSEASVNVRIVPESENAAPASIRSGAISVEQGQQISYNVLADWNDPDGDDLYLVNASPTSGDSVRFSPDGFVTFEHQSAELGLKEVQFTVSDGQHDGGRHADRRREAHRHAEPDRHARLRAGVRRRDRAHRAARERPHRRRVRRSSCSASTEVPDGAIRHPEPRAGHDRLLVRTSPASTSSCTTSAADAAVSVGLVRVQVVEPPAEAPPPIAVKDTAYLRPGEPHVGARARERRLAVGPRARRAVRRRHRDRRPRLGRDPHEHRGPRHRVRGARPPAAVQLHDLRRREHVDRHRHRRARCRRS